MPTTGTRSNRAAPSAITVARLAAVAAWLWLLGHEVLPAIGHVTQGFASYYAASYLVLHGASADLNNGAAFGAWMVRAGISISDIFQGNVPTLALLMIPLTVFSPEIAQTIWLALNVLMLATCVWLVGRLCAPDNSLTRCWIATVFPLLAPVRETIHWGQIYLLLALLSLVAIAALAQRRDGIAGIAVGLMLLLKPYYGALSLGVLLWQRRPRAPIATAATALVVALLSLPMLAGAWSDFPRLALAANDEPWATIPANQTVNSLLQHLFSFSPAWNPAPLLNVPGLAVVLRYALLIALLAVTLKNAFRRDRLWLWLPALALMPMLAPVGEAHHGTLLLWPVAVGVTRLVEHWHPYHGTVQPGIPSLLPEQRMKRVTRLLLCAALFLLIAPWPSVRDPALWDSWRALFAYPRLYGAFLLWATVGGGNFIDRGRSTGKQA